MKQDNLTIFLADDHELVANGIAQIFNGMHIVENVRVFSNGKNLYKAVLSSQPDIVFLDMEMPEWDGKKTLEQLKLNYPHIPCVILSMVDEKSVIEDCLKMGANGYLHKDSKADELLLAIEMIGKGNVFLSQETQKILTGQRKSIAQDSIDLTEPLTEREMEILKLICDGLTSKEIGEMLFVSHRTVETHKNNLMQKFGVKTTGKLISISIKNKIVK